ncbi:aminoglycoside phosphotransferase family protein, partial [Streptomyces sp. NPDC059374]|uniref:aminoglycoside phosphotransferase family protein n=1 Tax=Streptomyces sp. NPDC059374 TaxID=3346814 RepID=UPI00367F6D14
MAFEPPQRLVRALGETAPDGDAWLEELPRAARQAVELRELTVERVQLPGGRSSLVVLVRRADGTPAVLKLAPPRARPESERAALAHWGGRGGGPRVCVNNRSCRCALSARGPTTIGGGGSRSSASRPGSAG